ncbi:MAG: glycosyltransferase [Bacteroidota bacterium]
MKIAFQSVFYPYRGGIAQFNSSLFRALEKKAEVRAFNFSLQYPALFFPGSSQYVAADDAVDAVPSLRILNSINPVSYLKTANEIKAYQPDFLLTAYWMPFFAPSQGMVCRLVKDSIKTISIINNITPHERRWGDDVLNRFFLKQQQAHVVMGNAIKDELTRYISDAKVLLHPHPIYRHFGQRVDKEIALKKLELPTNKKTILFFGLIRTYKGLDVLIKAFNELSDEYQLIIAGESYKDFSKYQQLIDKSPNKSRIFTFRRYIPDHEVPYFFSVAQVCVLPYKKATQSGVVAIAFHFDVPVIVTDEGNLKDIISPYGTGIVVDEPEPLKIAKSIQHFFALDSPQQYLENISSFKQKFTWDHMAKEIIQLYQKI